MRKSLVQRFYRQDQLKKSIVNKTLGKQQYSVFFMRGTENQENLPNILQQQDLLQYVYKDTLQNSFLIFQPQVLQGQIDNIQAQLPWVRPHYAVKSNPIAPILDIVQHNGLGFDCASKQEIQTVLDMGVPPSDIIYSNSIKMEKDLYWAQQMGIQYTTADSLAEVEKIARLAPQLKVLWRIAIQEKNSQNLATIFSNKFGDDLQEDFHQTLQDKFKLIKNMGVTLGGIHFHCGSGQNGASNFKEAVQKARECIQLGRAVGHPMDIMDIGGGLPADRLGTEVLQALQTTYNDPLGYQVVAEPGRYFSSKTCQLATRVIGKRQKNGKDCYHLNDSLYHSFNCVLMDGVQFEDDQQQFYSQWTHQQLHPLQSVQHMQDGSLFGMTCDGYDIIARNIPLPNLQVGDWLLIAGMGSYTYGPKSTFNGMHALDTVYIHNPAPQQHVAISSATGYPLHHL